MQHKSVKVNIRDLEETLRRPWMWNFKRLESNCMCWRLTNLCPSVTFPHLLLMNFWASINLWHLPSHFCIKGGGAPPRQFLKYRHDENICVCFYLLWQPVPGINQYCIIYRASASLGMGYQSLWQPPFFQEPYAMISYILAECDPNILKVAVPWNTN